MKRLTLALILGVVVALTGYAVASDKTARLFSVVKPIDALFTQGAGYKQITLKLQNKRIKRLDVQIAVAVFATGETKNKSFERFSESVSGRGDTELNFNLPHLGLFNAQVTAQDSAGHTLGTQTIRLAALGPRAAELIPSVGVSTHFSRRSAQLPGTMDLIRRAGFGRIRDEIPWSRVERKPGQFTFPEYYDDYIADAVHRGIQPLIILGYANTKTYHHLLAHGSNFLATGRPMNLFENYVRAVVGRYGDQVHTWELWNEPNFGKKGVARRYNVLLKRTHSTLKKVAPKDKLIACGGAGVGGGPNGECFLDMLKYGAGKDMDGYSIHPYMGRNNPPGLGYVAYKSVIPRVSVPVVWRYNQKLIRQHRNRIGHEFSFWVTEIGWFTQPASHPESEIKQAAYLDQLYLLSRKYSQAKAVFWYNFRDVGENPKDKEDNFGLITYHYEPKPAYVAAATLSRTLGNRKWQRSLPRSAPGQEIEAYGSGAKMVIAAWTTKDTSKAKIDVLPGDYIVRHWDGTDKRVHVDSGPLTLSLGLLPMYIVKVS